jgi:hypothetical protein
MGGIKNPHIIHFLDGCHYACTGILGDCNITPSKYVKDWSLVTCKNCLRVHTPDSGLDSIPFIGGRP